MRGSEINLSLLHFAAINDKLEAADFLLKQVCLNPITWACLHEYRISESLRKVKQCCTKPLAHCMVCMLQVTLSNPMTVLYK